MKHFLFGIYLGLGIEIVCRLLSYVKNPYPWIRVVVNRYSDVGGVIVVSSVIGIVVSNFFYITFGNIFFGDDNNIVGLLVAFLIVFFYFKKLPKNKGNKEGDVN